MKYNLTEQQKGLAMAIAHAVEVKELPETFHVVSVHTGLGTNESYIAAWGLNNEDPSKHGATIKVSIDAFYALAEARLLVARKKPGSESSIFCTVTALLLKGSKTEFVEDDAIAPVSTLAQPHPPEITISLDRLRSKFPDPKKFGFLIMRFTAAKPYKRIVEIIQNEAASLGLSIIRADEHEFHGELWGNVRTYLHGCGFGIAVYERIESNEPNANIGLEVGYLMAMNKPVLLLKDKTLETLQADLAGKLYKEFDPHNPEETIPSQLKKWLIDYGIVVPSP